jgi:hypothetical protein
MLSSWPHAVTEKADDHHTGLLGTHPTARNEAPIRGAETKQEVKFRKQKWMLS